MSSLTGDDERVAPCSERLVVPDAVICQAGYSVVLSRDRPRLVLLLSSSECISAS